MYVDLSVLGGEDEPIHLLQGEVSRDECYYSKGEVKEVLEGQGGIEKC